MTPDVNVLVSAFRPDHPHHLPARACLNAAVQQAANGRASLMLLDMVVTGFMRITTNPKILVRPIIEHTLFSEIVMISDAQRAPSPASRAFREIAHKLVAKTAGSTKKQ